MGFVSVSLIPRLRLSYHLMVTVVMNSPEQAIWGNASVANALLSSKEFMENKGGCESLGLEKCSQSQSGWESDLEREAEAGLEI